MITANEAFIISLGYEENITKKYLAETIHIEKQIKERALKEENYLIYSIYKDELQDNDFKNLWLRITEELKQLGYLVCPRNNPTNYNKLYTFKIIWMGTEEQEVA